MDNPMPEYRSNPFQLIRPSISALARTAGTLILVVLIALGVILVGVGFVVLMFVPSQLHFLAVILGVLAIAACVVMLLLYLPWVYTRIILAAAGGQKLSLGAAWPKWGQALRLFGTSLLAGLAILGGIVLLVVPGIIFAVWLTLVPYVVVDEGIGGIAALRRSRDLVRGRFWEIAGSNLLSSITGLIAWVPVVGVVAELVLAILLIPVTAIRYHSIKELKSHEGWEKVPVSGWNYAIFALGVAGSIVSGVVSHHDQAKNSLNTSPTSVENSLY